jgi:hypothetical protein
LPQGSVAKGRPLCDRGRQNAIGRDAGCLPITHRKASIRSTIQVLIKDWRVIPRRSASDHFIDMVAVSLVLAFATALLFSLAAVPVVLRVATAYGFFDLSDSPQPMEFAKTTSSGPRCIHSQPIPRLGGITHRFLEGVSSMMIRYSFAS